MAIPSQEMVIGGYWTDSPYRQVSAITSQYHTIVMGKRGLRWALPAHGYSHGIAVESIPNNRGCGGGTVTFMQEDGTTVDFVGPWFSNPDSLFEDTGIDLREKHLTWGCIGRHRDHAPDPSGYGSGRQVIADLLWWDPVDDQGNRIAQVGQFERVRDIAQQMAKDRDELVFAFSGSYGGSSCGYESPFSGKGIEFVGRTKAEEPYWEKYRAEFGDSRQIYKLPPVDLKHADLWLEGIDYEVKDVDIEKIRDNAGLVMENMSDYGEY